MCTVSQIIYRLTGTVMENALSPSGFNLVCGTSRYCPSDDLSDLLFFLYIMRSVREEGAMRMFFVRSRMLNF